VLVQSLRTRRAPQFCIPGESHAAQFALLATALYVLVAHAVHPHSVAAAWLPAAQTSVLIQAVQKEFWVSVHSKR